MHNNHHTGSAASTSCTAHLADEAATLQLGEQLATILHPGLTVFLYGELGAGKTTLARGILRGFGHQGKVRSPTYNLVEIYKFSRLYLYHFDFYRLNDPAEWEEAGFREYFNQASICLIEWPEKATGVLRTADLKITLTYSGTGRIVKIDAETEAGKRCLAHWQSLKLR
ncbi:MAG TPA: tRNA (adenosine(37)-N6)-threonylcarbamoyltransferase complex ATPase subunit type 1 TsaE [Nitrosomonas halophila]|nr:tRNA (adenosine(37)-N6)-threonylcarbamoyltransferase complex ATPase subunit type 1 TsaE [Nitrosomonas halophila]